MKRTYRTEHPLYIIPAEYKALREMFEDHDLMEISDVMPNGDLHVYASEFGPETAYGFDGEWDYHEGTLADFVPEYTPTPEEVMRALRGPKGDTGPMGPQGDRGESRKCECLEVEDSLLSEADEARWGRQSSTDLSEGGGQAKGSER